MNVSRGFAISDITIVFGIAFSMSAFAFFKSATFFCASAYSGACVSRKSFCNCAFCSGVRLSAGIAAIAIVAPAPSEATSPAASVRPYTRKSSTRPVNSGPAAPRRPMLNGSGVLIVSVSVSTTTFVFSSCPFTYIFTPTPLPEPS